MEENIKFPTELLEPLILKNSLRSPSFLFKIAQHLDTTKLKGKSYFNDEKFQKVFNIISSFYFKFKRPPTKDTLKTMVDKVERDGELKLLMQSIVDKAYEEEEINTDFIEEETLNFIKEAKVYEAILGSQIDLEKRNFANVVTRVEEAVRINFDKDLGISIKDYEEAFNRIRKIDQEEKIPTNFGHFDSMIDGGLHGKEIYCIAGTPGLGKTLILGNMAINCFLSGKNVLVYTFETSTERLLMRYYANLAETTKKDMMLNEEGTKEKIKSKLEDKTGNLILKEYNANSVCSNDLMSHINDLMMYQKFKPDVVVVDYLLIMRTNDRTMSSDNSYRYFKTVTEELRNIAKTLSVPVITACQINREGMSDTGRGKATITTAKDISESRGIYDTVDVFVTISQTANDYKKKKLCLYFDKNRNNRTGTKIEYTVDYEHMKLSERSIVEV